MAILVTACSSAEGDSLTATGGVVRVLGSWEGPELASFRAMVAPFEHRTGIRVEYTATRDLEGVLSRGIAAGVAPDVAGLPGPGLMPQLVASGALKDLRGVIDLGRYKAETAPAFVDLGTVDGKLAGVFIKATVKGLFWYNPDVYDLGTPASWSDLQQSARDATSGTMRPWCVGLESGAASGWPGTDWVEDFLLRQSGAAAYDAWVAGTLPWTSPEVRRAFESFGQIVANGAVFGASSGALRTYFADAGRPLFTDPPGCLFLHQGSFMSSFLSDVPGDPAPGYDFLPFPDIDPRYSGSLIGAGDLMGMIRDTPPAREFVRYLVSAEAQSIWVRRGGALSGNARVRDYPDPLAAREARLLTTARVFRFDASDSMPEPMNRAFWQAVLDYAADQSSLRSILEHLDAVRLVTYRK